MSGYRISGDLNRRLFMRSA